VGEGGWELELTQEIELGGRYHLRTEAAELGIRRAELDLQGVEAQLRSEARTSYARLAAAESKLRLLDTLLRFSRRMDTIAGRLLSAEEISELDRNAIRIERGRVEIERVQASSDVASARSELAWLVALPSGTVVTTAVGALDTIDRSMALLDTAARVERALASGDESILQRRPEWQALDRARERALVERSLASRRWVPSLRVGLGYQSETTVTGVDPTGHNSTGSAAIETDRLLGLRFGVALPLPFSGLYDLGSGDIALADVEISIIEAERARLAARLRADLARAAGRLRAAAEAAAIYQREIAPYITRNIRLLERGYAAGELSATEIVSQQEQFVRTSQALVDARREYWEAVADFQRATGD
jgi:outer membrane protein TolC